MTFDSLFADARGRTSRAAFVGALATLVAAAAFYYVLVKGRTGQWCLVVLLFPAIVLHARRLHDMGRSAWWLAIPAALMLATFAAWLRLVSLEGAVATALPVAALAVWAAFAVWGLLGRGQAGANRFGEPAT
jgi:uncharacterized membrane protein YhaH (DUF805 family)